MDIEKLEASRELDVIVAETIMDWRWMEVIEGRAPIFMPPEQWQDYNPKYIRSVWVKGYEGFAPDRLPRYSTEIAAAWLIIEKLRERFTNIALHAANGYGLTVWNIFEGVQEENIYGPFNADTAPLAICKTGMAALTSHQTRPQQ